MEYKAGMARIRKLAEWLEREHSSAAASLREGLEECFTIHRLGLPPSLQLCLATTNIIESPQMVCASAPAASQIGKMAQWRGAG